MQSIVNKIQIVLHPQRGYGLKDLENRPNRYPPDTQEGVARHLLVLRSGESFPHLKILLFSSSVLFFLLILLNPLLAINPQEKNRFFYYL